MAKIFFTHSYEKKASKFLKQHPELINQYTKTLKLLELNPNHPSLRLHQLKGKLSDLHSISINLSYRIILEFILQKDTIIPISIGSHDKTYR
jgi:proteic killer suppression protein